MSDGDDGAAFRQAFHASLMRRSDSAVHEAVGSSRNSTGASFRNALARHSLWRWPPDRLGAALVQDGVVAGRQSLNELVSVGESRCPDHLFVVAPALPRRMFP